MVNENALASVADTLSVTRIVNENVPPTAGDPLMIPVAGSKPKPSGSAPTDTAHV
jgi:hypothetical protein